MPDDRSPKEEKFSCTLNSGALSCQTLTASEDLPVLEQVADLVQVKSGSGNDPVIAANWSPHLAFKGRTTASYEKLDCENTSPDAGNMTFTKHTQSCDQTIHLERTSENCKGDASSTSDVDGEEPPQDRRQPTDKKPCEGSNQEEHGFERSEMSARTLFCGPADNQCNLQTHSQQDEDQESNEEKAKEQVSFDPTPTSPHNYLVSSASFGSTQKQGLLMLLGDCTHVSHKVGQTNHCELQSEDQSNSKASNYFADSCDLRQEHDPLKSDYGSRKSSGKANCEDMYLNSSSMAQTSTPVPTSPQSAVTKRLSNLGKKVKQKQTPPGTSLLLRSIHEQQSPNAGTKQFYCHSCEIVTNHENRSNSRGTAIHT